MKAIVRFIYYIVWRLLFSKKLLKYKNIHKGETCFIIGNGPSLNRMDLRPLANHYTFGLNKIYLMFDKVDLNLSYLVSVNMEVIKQSKEVYQNLTIPTFLSYLHSANLEFRNKSLNYIFSIGGVKFSKNISKQTFEGATVTFVALQIAYYMGFEKVFLIGVDHNFKSSGNPYEYQKLEGKDVNHFDPKYFSGQLWGIPDLETSQKAYKMAKEVFERDGRKIFDATVEGKLKVFKKISYNEALRLSTKK